MDATELGQKFVDAGYLTPQQLSRALVAVNEGVNFLIYILRKRWVTEAEVKHIESGAELGSPKRSSQAVRTEVALNRMEAHQTHLLGTLEKFEAFGRDLIGEAVEDLPRAPKVRRRPRPTNPMWHVPKEILESGPKEDEE